jgi:hypothetical protein
MRLMRMLIALASPLIALAVRLLTRKVDPQMPPERLS